MDGIKHDIEVQIRGSFLKINCEIEVLLYCTMMACSGDLNRLNEFVDMKMYNKIQATIADLKKYKIDVYREYEKQLEVLWVFYEFRNKICHRPMLVNDNLETFKFGFFGLYNGQPDAVEETYIIDHVLDAIIEYVKFGDILREMIKKINPDLDVF